MLYALYLQMMLFLDKDRTMDNVQKPLNTSQY
jgi:hypothetical protein